MTAAARRTLPPPPTDAGSVPNLRFSFHDAHPRLEQGGWAREVTERELPVATALAGVNMALEPGAVRELHWHKQAEWAYMLAGRARITAIDVEGRPFRDDVGVGEGWNFPAGIPHSIQGLEQGCEFLLVFDDGGFSEDATFLLCDWGAHTPTDVLARSLQLDREDVLGRPAAERYIFPAALPGALDPHPEPGFGHRLTAVAPMRRPGGSVRVLDARNFPASRTIAAALVEVEPGALRELHWHPHADEWQYYVAGQGRMTVFAAEGRARTFDYAAGDVGYVPHAMGHAIQNTGRDTLVFLEMFRADRFAEVSLRRWLAGTPPALVSAHLGIPVARLTSLASDERPVVR